MTRYRIHIEQVIVEGVAAGSRGAFADALARELESTLLAALAERSLGAEALLDGHVELLSGAPIRVSAHHPDGLLASSSARSIAGALSQVATQRPEGGGPRGD